MKIFNYQPIYIKKINLEKNDYRINMKKFISKKDMDNEINRKKIIYNTKKKY